MKNLFVFAAFFLGAFQLIAQDVSIAFHYASSDCMSAIDYPSTHNLIPVMNAPIVRSAQGSQQHVLSLWSFQRFSFFKEMIALSAQEDVKIHSFKMVRKTKRYDPFMGQNNGCHIDPEIRNQVRKAEKGDQFYIYDVTVKCPDGHVYAFPYTAIAEVN